MTKTISRHRTFDGRAYTYTGYRESKELATSDAETYRHWGRRCRIVTMKPNGTTRHKTIYTIWVSRM